MLQVVGTIVGMTSREVTPNRSKGQDFDPFTVFTYFVSDERGGAPTQVRSAATGRTVGDEVRLNVWIRPWQSQKTGRTGFEIREIKDQK